METIYRDYRLRLMKSSSSPDELFALIGHYLSSPRIRRECGGYALNDGPFYRWFIAQKQGESKATGFLSFEVKEDVMVLHHGYVAPVHRAQGIFSTMLKLVLDEADNRALPIQVRVMPASIPHLEKLGFEITGNRGHWHKLIRTARSNGRVN
jgi:GNAT superfamily N-acetyltransferase